MNSFSNPFAYADPRLIAAAHAEAAARNRRRGPPQQGEEANEVASFLLQLKHRNATEAQLAEIAAQEDVERRMLFQQAQLRAAVAHSQGYPSMGPIYGLPAGMDLRQSFMERAGAQPVHTSSHLEEPVVSEISWEHLLGDSKLVYMKDRDLVPDALFVVMAQMKACKLTQADRVGCYKNREIGFVGMCCKHCGGQPGFGRYYPTQSVRWLKPQPVKRSSSILEANADSALLICDKPFWNSNVSKLPRKASRRAVHDMDPERSSFNVFGLVYMDPRRTSLRQMTMKIPRLDRKTRTAKILQTTLNDHKRLPFRSVRQRRKLRGKMDPMPKRLVSDARGRYGHESSQEPLRRYQPSLGCRATHSIDYRTIIREIPSSCVN